MTINNDNSFSFYPYHNFKYDRIDLSSIMIIKSFAGDLDEMTSILDDVEKFLSSQGYGTALFIHDLRSGDQELYLFVSDSLCERITRDSIKEFYEREHIDSSHVDAEFTPYK